MYQWWTRFVGTLGSVVLSSIILTGEFADPHEQNAVSTIARAVARSRSDHNHLVVHHITRRQACVVCILLNDIHILRSQLPLQL